MRSWKGQITEGIKPPNRERMRTVGEKENYKYSGISLKGETPGPPCKIFEIILEVDEGRTSTNGSGDKKTIDDVRVLIFEGDVIDRLYVSKKEENNLPVLKIVWIHQYEDAKNSFKKRPRKPNDSDQK